MVNNEYANVWKVRWTVVFDTPRLTGRIKKASTASEISGLNMRKGNAR